MTSGNFQHPHIFLVGSSKSKEFTRPGGGGSETVVYPRNRREHGQFLLRKLEEINKKIPTHNLLRNKNNLTGDDGIYLLFESPANYELPFSSLEYQHSGIELLSVNKKLINSIEDIRISTLRSLWTDPEELFPVGLTSSDYGSFSDHCSKEETISDKWSSDVILKVTQKDKSGRPSKYLLK